MFFTLLMIPVLLGHWYLWRRLVRDVSLPRSRWRRTGTVLVFALSGLVFAAFVARRSAPFVVEQVLAWPGYLWVAMMLYLFLALLVGEFVRPVLRRVLERRAASAEPGDASGSDGSAAPAAEEPLEAETQAPGDGGGGTALATETKTAGTDVRDTAEAEPGAAGATGPPAAPGGADGRGGAGSAAPADPSRRLFVARTVAAGAALVATGTVGAGAYGVLNGPTLKNVTVPLAKLPRSAHGYRIAVVSDIHIGAILGRGHLQRIVDTINSAQPDLIAIVGDLVDGSVEHLGAAADPLRRLKARDGSFFVTGNHEYFGDAAEWIDRLGELGVRTLENSRLEMPGFDLAGVNDVQGEEEGEGPDFNKALGDRDTSRASVLLAHQPVQIHEAVDHGVDLQLSGHSHGGQMWPLNYLAALANPTVAGLERYGDTQLYVTRGAGAWGPPVRVGAESDVTIVKLASKRA